MMKTNDLSAPVTAPNPSMDTMAAWDSRSPGISSKETERTSASGVGLAFLLVAFLGFCFTDQLRAQMIVVPNSLATDDGNSFITTPSGSGSVREMLIYDASQFGALSKPSLLTQFAFRPDMTPGPSGPRALSLRIFASTTSRSVNGLSPTFAENHGADKTLVYDGTLIWQTANLPGSGNTRQFDIVFPLTTPFLYHRAAGNLLLDIQFTANGSSIRIDTVTGNQTLGQLVNVTSSTGATGFSTTPKPTQFIFASPPFSDANWSSLGRFANDDGWVQAAVVDDSGNLYIGGLFNVAGGWVANGVAKWNGSSWSALGSGLDGGDGPQVFALAVSGGDLYAGGRFTTAGGQAATNIARWNGSSWSALGSGLRGGEYSHVSALAVSGSDLYVGGRFTSAGGQAATNVAKWNGSGWTALGSGIGDYTVVSALAVSGSNVYAAPLHDGWGTVAKWDGSSWSELRSAQGSGIGGWVYALAVSGSDLYAGGHINTADGHAANHIAKWDGSSWTALGSGMDQEVRALAVSGSDLYAGGGFSTAGSGAANHIAKWDGNSWSALASGMNDAVRALAVSGSDLYAAGGFTMAGGKVSAYAARAYLLALPTLSVLRSGENVTVSWATVDTADFALEQAGPLAAPAAWITNSATVTDDGTNRSVTLPASDSPQFFRLRRP